MRKVKTLLAFILVPFLLTAQSVLITPGAQSINGDSTIQNQLNAFGNGLLVGPKVKFTDVDPASNVYNMNCSTNPSFTYNYSLAGTLKDPYGDSGYLGGLTHDCSFRFIANNVSFVGYQIDFEVLDTEANGDSVFILDSYNYPVVIASFSGNSLPESLRILTSDITIRFKTDGDSQVGAGFVLKWKAILKDDTPTPIKNFTGEGLSYDVLSNSLWAGRHNPLDFENKGGHSTALGYNSKAIGTTSTAMGYETLASGYASTVMGYETVASGDYSTAMGRATTADTTYSTAMGAYSTASGYSSTAMGYNTKASGNYSITMGRSTRADTIYATAMGHSTKALGYASTAMGESTEADSSYATAMGYYTSALGYASTAMGSSTTANGDNSTAMGQITMASGDNSMAMGENTEASGDNSTSMGQNTKAGGNNSTAIGKDVTANGQGTLIIGDSNPGGVVYTSLTEDKFIARFYNGYYFLTSASGATSTGVSIGHGQTAWSSISDSTKKENFIPANGDAFLGKLKDLKLGSWNYKTNKVNPERFYGPMAQEIYAAYGKDAKGTIGSDTLVSTLNMDGLLFIFAQELEKRTTNLKEENSALKSEVDALKEKYEKSVVANKHLENDFEQRISQLEKLLTVKSEGDLAKLP